MAATNFSAKSILGKGLTFPFAFSGTTTTSNRGVDMSEDEEKVRQSLIVIIGTALGARIMRRAWGCGLRDLVFQPIQSDLELLAEHLIRDAVLKLEKRVALGPMDFKAVSDQGRVDIGIEYVILKTRATGSLVYPFYVSGNTPSEAS